MGMYTQFIIECKLKENTPTEVIECLSDMVDHVKNEVFTYERNPLTNYCESNDYDPSFSNLILKAHGDIKNYWSDIERFVEFIKPYIEKGLLEDEAFAKSLYEDSEYWIYYFTFKGNSYEYDDK